MKEGPWEAKVNQQEPPNLAPFMEMPVMTQLLMNPPQVN
jgi:hypothetical protein